VKRVVSARRSLPPAFLPPVLPAIGLILGLAVALSGCSFPPYQEDLSLGVITASKLGEPLAFVGPLYNWTEELIQRDTVFVPSKQDLHLWAAEGDPIEGFVVAAGDYSARLISVRYDPGSEKYFMSTDSFQPIVNSDPNAFVYQAETIEGGDLLSLTYFDPESPRPRGFVVLNQDLNQGGIPARELNTEFAAPPLSLSSPLVIGAGFYPDPDTSFDRLYALAVDSSGRFTEAGYETDPGSGLINQALVPGRLQVAISGLPGGLRQGFYHFDPVSLYSYFSTYDEEKNRFRTYRWNDGLAATELTGVKFPVRAVLSTGRLFARGDTMGYVYDRNGNRINRFPMGGLHLACELIDGAGDNWLYFTLRAFGRDPEVPENQNQDREYVLFLVYRIRTRDIDTL
jgi:hypothetical protein